MGPFTGNSRVPAGSGAAAPGVPPMVNCVTTAPKLTMPMPEADIDQRVWQVVALIPAGKVATYGDVARLAGLPGAARRVGRALRGLPAGTRIPWHRVVNASGRISLPAGSEGYRRQQSLLQAEGVPFSNGRLPLDSYRWQP